MPAPILSAGNLRQAMQALRKTAWHAKVVKARGAKCLHETFEVPATVARLLAEHQPSLAAHRVIRCLILTTSSAFALSERRRSPFGAIPAWIGADETQQIEIDWVVPLLRADLKVLPADDPFVQGLSTDGHRRIDVLLSTAASYDVVAVIIDPAATHPLPLYIDALERRARPDQPIYLLHAGERGMAMVAAELALLRLGRLGHPRNNPMASSREPSETAILPRVTVLPPERVRDVSDNDWNLAIPLAACLAGGPEWALTPWQLKQTEAILGADDNILHVPTSFAVDRTTGAVYFDDHLTTRHGRIRIPVTVRNLPEPFLEDAPLLQRGYLALLMARELPEFVAITLEDRPPIGEDGEPLESEDFDCVEELSPLKPPAELAAVHAQSQRRRVLSAVRRGLALALDLNVPDDRLCRAIFEQDHWGVVEALVAGADPNPGNVWRGIPDQLLDDEEICASLTNAHRFVLVEVCKPTQEPSGAADGDEQHGDEEEEGGGGRDEEGLAAYDEFLRLIERHASPFVASRLRGAWLPEHSCFHINVTRCRLPSGIAAAIHASQPRPSPITTRVGQTVRPYGAMLVLDGLLPAETLTMPIGHDAEPLQYPNHTFMGALSKGLAIRDHGEREGATHLMLAQHRSVAACRADAKQPTPPPEQPSDAAAEHPEINVTVAAQTDGEEAAATPDTTPKPVSSTQDAPGFAIQLQAVLGVGHRRPELGVDALARDVRTRIGVWINSHGREVAAEVFHQERTEREEVAFSLTIDALPDLSLWCLRYDHADAVQPGRQWRTEIVLMPRGTQLFLGFRLVVLDPHRLGELPTRTVPRILRELAAEVGLDDNGIPLDGQCHEPSEIRLPGEVNWIASPRRDRPVVVTTVPRDGAHPVTGERIAQAFGPTARVLHLGPREAAWWKRRFGAEHALQPRQVRIYSPGESPESYAADAITLVSSRQLQPLLHATLRQVITRSLTHDDFPGLLQVRQMLHEHRLARAQGQGEVDREREAHEARKVEDAQRQNLELTELLKHADEERVEIERERDEAQELVRTLRAQLFHLSKRREGVVAETEQIPIPSSFDDLSDWANTHLQGRLIISSKAATAARKSVFANVPLAYEALKALAFDYWPMRVNGDADARARWHDFLKDNRMDFGPTGAALDTRQTRETYQVSYGKQRLPLDMHLQGSSSRKETDCFRCYIHVHTDDSVIVVGWMPGHLPNSLA